MRRSVRVAHAWLLAITLTACHRSPRKAIDAGPRPTPIPTVLPPSIAVGVVVDGSRMFVGDRDYTPDASDDDQDAPIKGVLPEIKQAIHALAVVPGQLQVVFYGEGVIGSATTGFEPASRVIQAVDKLEQLDFTNQEVEDLFPGIDFALDALDKRPERHKVLIVIADGVERSDRPVAELVKRARELGVTIYAVDHQTELDDNAEGAANLRVLGALGEYIVAAPPAAIPPSMKRLAEKLAQTR
jgi:hypothetical protein